jgi:hypothetical protein
MRRIIGLKQAGSAIASLVFILLSYIPYHINTGNIRDVGWLYLPLLTYFVARTKEKRSYVVCSAVVISLLILNGFSIYVLPLMLFLALFVLLDTLRKPEHRLLNKKPLIVPFIFILLIVFLLSAVKLFPALDLIRTADRSIDSYEEASNNAITFHKLGLALFSRGPYAVGNEAVVGPHILGPGAAMYIGVIPALVFLLAIAFHFRRLWTFLLVMVVFIMLSMADNSPVDLFRMLWYFPLFHSMREPARYFMFPAVFMMSAIIGGFLSSSFFRRIRPKARWAIYGIILIAVADMFISNTQYFVFTGGALHQVNDIDWNDEFFNVMKVNPTDDDLTELKDKKKWGKRLSEELAPGIHYYLLRQNIGLIDWWGGINLEERAEPRYLVLNGYGDYWHDLRSDTSLSNGVKENPYYRGESWFNSSGRNKIHAVSWQANTITVDVELSQPDLLIVNQNYDSGWTAGEGEVLEVDGLLGVKIDRMGSFPVTMLYRPSSFYFGAAVTLVTIAGLGLCFWKRQAKKPGVVRRAGSRRSGKQKNR